jgi:putative colanic acid biosynthesis glycosyltransferase
MKTFLESSSEVNFNIITICQNNLEGLQRTVSSIKIQGHKKIKLIIIDGASTDGTTEFLSSLKFEGTWVSEPDNGIYDAMNKGLTYCDPGLTIWLNSGDVFLHQNDLARIATSHQLTNWLWAYGDLRYFDYKRARIISEHSQTPFNFQLLRFGIRWIPHQATIFSHEILQYLKNYSTSVGYGADQEFMLRAANIAKPEHLNFFEVQMDIGGVSRKKNNTVRSKMWRQIRSDNELLLLRSSNLDLASEPILQILNFIHSWYMRARRKSKYYLD